MSKYDLSIKVYEFTQGQMTRFHNKSQLLIEMKRPSAMIILQKQPDMKNKMHEIFFLILENKHATFSVPMRCHP